MLPLPFFAILRLQSVWELKGIYVQKRFCAPFENLVGKFVRKTKERKKTTQQTLAGSKLLNNSILALYCHDMISKGIRNLLQHR